MRAPKMDVATSFSGSRSAGQKTAASSPSAAARAATAFARLPVEEQASVVRPSSCAFAHATATTRSLNECVGLAVSSLRYSSPMPSASASLGAAGRAAPLLTDGAVADALERAAALVRERTAPILEANRADCEAAAGRVDEGTLDRLRLDESRVETLARQVEATASVPPLERDG